MLIQCFFNVSVMLNTAFMETHFCNMFRQFFIFVWECNDGMSENTKSYQKILNATTHVSFICYTLGYVMGMLDYYSMGITNLFLEDAFIISVFLITYMLFVLKKLKMQPAMMILGTLVVADLLYPGIILPSHIPNDRFHEETIAILLILMFVIPLTTNRLFSIVLIASSIVIVVSSAIIHNDVIMLNILPIVVLCLGGIGIFSIVFQSLIKRLLTQLQESKIKIEELSDYKQKMIRHVIHDLRVPINTIMNLSTGKQSDTSQKIERQAFNVNRQLEKILDIDRLEEPNLILKKESVSVKEVVVAAMESVQVLADEKQISIQSHFRQSGFLSCDKELVERVLINLLTNGIKYSPTNSVIEIFIDEKDSHCEIAVVDNGRGIADEHQLHIFEKFYFIKQEKSKSTFSTGLGLAFCKLVVDAHHGTIQLKSQVGRGSVFTVLLPDFSSVDTRDDLTLSSLAVELTQREKNDLLEICNKLAVMPVYKLSEIINVLKEVEQNGNPAVSLWCQRITDAVYAGNEKVFHELINMCKSE